MPLFNSGMVSKVSLRLAAGRKFVTLSNYLAWSSYITVGGRYFAQGPKSHFIIKNIKYKEFLILAAELLAFDLGHTADLR